MHPALPYIFQMVIGAIVIYIALGSQLAPYGLGFSLGWIRDIYSEDAIIGYPMIVGMSGLFGAFLWSRGARLASVEYPVEHLSRNFRIGLLILAVAAIADIVSDVDLRIFPLMFLFFAAGLTGLSAGHLLPASEQTMDSKSWPRLISGIIVVVMVMGLLFSLLQKGVLTYISTPVGFVLNAFATVVFFVILIPLVYILEFLVKGFLAILTRIIGVREQALDIDTGVGFSELLQDLREDSVDTGPSMFLQYLEWTLLAIIIGVVLYFLARSFRRRVRWRQVDNEGVRESVSEDADAMTDFGRLLYNLIPERFRRKKAQRTIPLPDDEADIVDVFRIYFGMLMLAEDRGNPRPQHQTPSEYQTTLERMFPQRLVRMVTHAFNRACYGHQGASRAQINEMRQGLDQANSESDTTE
jgi:AcrR family transcriptional regulator